MFDIRNAGPSDAAFIARNIVAAMGYDVFSPGSLEAVMDFDGRELTLREAMEAFIPICLRDDTLYYWGRTRISTVDGIPTGSLTAYPGADYLTMRDRTWGDWGRSLGVDATVSQEPECFPGEYYLDTLAVLPSWRGQVFEHCGVSDRTGHLLMLDAFRQGRGLGLKQASLIVDIDHPRVEEYYSGVGFRPAGQMMFFGHPYMRMRAALD